MILFLGRRRRRRSRRRINGTFSALNALACLIHAHNSDGVGEAAGDTRDLKAFETVDFLRPGRRLDAYFIRVAVTTCTVCGYDDDRDAKQSRKSETLAT